MKYEVMLVDTLIKTYYATVEAESEDEVEEALEGMKAEMRLRNPDELEGYDDMDYWEDECGECSGECPGCTDD